MNTFYHGDCKFVLSHDIESQSVDLIYLDPPFFTGKVQKGTTKWQPETMEISYEDSKRFWVDKASTMREKAPEWLKHIALERPDFASYLYYMLERLRLCHKVLAHRGTLYLHCDYRASHYLKMILDEVFKPSNFINEIVWCYEDIGGRAVGYFKRKHDIIFAYQKSDERTFHIQYKPLSVSTIKRYEKYFDANGQITYQHLKDTNPGVFKKLKGIPDDLSLVWLDMNKGQPMGDWWSDISAIRVGFDESTGYPTQKPIKLLERIINASSNDNDLVLDPFCGCGTAIIAAHKLNRRWIGIDINKSAYEVTQGRHVQMPLGMQQEFVNAKYIPRDLDEVGQLKPREFEAWVNEFFKATKPQPDRGVDGIMQDGTPIQSKTYVIKYDKLSQFINDAKYHPLVLPKPIKKVMAVSQSGFDESARKRQFEIETAEHIKVELITPEDMLMLQ
jgi:DNA modification methylase